MRKPTRHPGRRAGYTLIEALIVLGVIGIIAAILVPSITQMIQREQARAFARTSEAFLNFARLRGIRSGRPVHVLFDTDPNVNGELRTAVRAELDEDADGVGDLVINREVLPGSIKLVAPPGLPVVVGFAVDEGSVNDPRLTRIVFNPDGSVEATGALRYADGRGNLFELAVGPSRAVGRVEVRKWDGMNFWARGDGPTDWKWR